MQLIYDLYNKMYKSLIYSLNKTNSQTIVDAATTRGVEAFIHPKNPHSVYVSSNIKEDIDQLYTLFEGNENYNVYYHSAHTSYRDNVCTKTPLRTDIVAPNLVPPYSGTGKISEFASFYHFPTYNPTSGSIKPKIGILSLGGNYLASDLTAQWSFNGQNLSVLPTVTLVPVPSSYTVPTFGSDSNADGENALDMQVIGGSCTNANIMFYSAANTFQSFIDIINQALTDNCIILSMSWGAVESNWSGFQNSINSAFQNATANGLVIPVAAGDNGCFPVTNGVYQIQLPAGLPDAVTMGGTSLAGSVEQVWNNTGFSTGGGQSIYFARPAYQTTLTQVVPATPIISGAFTPFPRTIPDIAFNADQGSPYTIFVNGISSGIGGTSACSPLVSGLLGIIYALSSAGSLPRIGYIPNGFNYYLYSSPSNCFNDITIGNNDAQNPSNIPQTAAQVGFDMSTGIGTVNGQNLFNYLSNYTCVAKGTIISLADGTFKPIQDIKHGDRILGGLSQYATELPVDKVVKQLISSESLIDVMNFLPNSMGNGIPTNKLIITHKHPIFINDKHIYADYFIGTKDVLSFSKCKASECLPIDSDGNYYLYDLQFTCSYTYIAEGIVVQARPPSRR